MQNVIKKVDRLYNVRFSANEKQMKERIWQVLCTEFLQQFVRRDATIVDLAAGYCEFINHIQGKTKIAIDLNPETKFYAGKDVIFLKADVTKLPKNLDTRVDVVFVGCLLEHLPSKDVVLALFENVKRILKPGGRFLILNPNIRFSTSDYWDYFDHVLPVSDRSVVEGLQLAGFEVERVIPRFVPNTTKDALPKSPLLVKLYLHLPFLFPIFGRQMFIVARKSMPQRTSFGK